MRFNTNLSAGTTIALRLSKNSGVLDAFIDWGDGSGEERAREDAYYSHVYAQEGVYDVRVWGRVGRFGVPDGAPLLPSTGIDKLTHVLSFGKLNVTSLRGAFYGATNLVSVPTELPESVLSLNNLFRDAAQFNDPNVLQWDVSRVVNFSRTFRGATIFNQPIGSWDVGNGIDFSQTFALTGAFNQDIGSWDMRNATNLSAMFNTSAFNNGGSASIDGWQTSRVDTLTNAFRACPFNQPIGGWDTSSVKSFNGMFTDNTAFNRDLSAWNLSSATNTRDMFLRATAYNNGGSPGISNWDTSNVTLFIQMFAGATSFNQPVGNWDISKAESITQFVDGATAFNQNLGGFKLNPAGFVASIAFRNTAMNAENYSRTLIGWANFVSGQSNLPSAVALGAQGRTFNATNYGGAPFNNAVDARNYLLGLGWTFTGDSLV